MPQEVNSSECLVMVSDGGSPTPTFAELEGSQDCTVSITTTFADTTAKDNGGWTSQKGVISSMSVTGTILLKETAAAAANQNRILHAINNRSPVTIRAHVAADRYYEAECYVSGEYPAPTSDVVKVNLTFNNAGSVTATGFAVPT